MVIISIVLEFAFILVYIGKCRDAPTFHRNPCFKDSDIPSNKCISFIAQCRNWTWNETLSNFATASQLLKEHRLPFYSNGNGLLSRAVACLAVPNYMPDDGDCAKCGRYCVNKMSTEKKFCSLYCPLPFPSRYNHISKGIATATASQERKGATKFANLLHTRTDNLLLSKLILLCFVIVGVCAGVGLIIFIWIISKAA